MNLIKPVNIKKYTYNDNNIIEDFWEVQEYSSTIRPGFTLGIKLDALVQRIETLAKSTLCIQSDKELNPKILNLINELYKKGINIYLITNQIYPSYKHTIVGKVLIRYSNNISGDLIIVDPYNIYSEVYVSDNLNMNEEKAFYRLCDTNKKELYELFCWRFWKNTDYEVYDIDSLDSNIEVGEVPFDLFPNTDTKYVLHNEHIINNINDSIIKYIDNSKYEITVMAKSINLDSEILNKLIDKKYSCKINIIFKYDLCFEKIVRNLDLDGINLYVTKDNMFMDAIICDNLECIISSSNIYNKKINSHAIIIKNKEDVENICIYRDNLINNENTYLYRKSKQLKDIQSKYILDRLDSENNIERSIEKEIDEGVEIVDKLRNLKDGIISKKLTNKYPYANKIIHNINLIPKYRNKNISFDKIYEDWENEYTNLLNYLSNIYVNLRKFESDNKLFKQFITRIFSKQKEYNVDINEILENISKLQFNINNRVYNNREYESYKIMIKDIYDEYIKLSNNIEKVKVINKQEEEWNHKKEEKQANIYNLNKKIEKIDNDILEIQGRFNEELYNSVNIKIERFNKEIENISKQTNPIALNEDTFRNRAKKMSDRINILKPKFKKNKDIDPIVKEISNILDEMHYSNYFDNNIKNHLSINSGNIVNIKKELKRLIDEEVIGYINNSISDKDKENLSLIREIKANINVMMAEYKDINKEKEKINKEITKLNTEKNNILKLLIKEDEELKELGDNFKPNLEGVKLKKISTEMYKFKELEELPKVGKLYSDKKGNNRELAIYNWEDLDIGEAEAIRLNANLVCEIG